MGVKTVELEDENEEGILEKKKKKKMTVLCAVSRVKMKVFH